MAKLPPFLRYELTRHGKRVWYVRRDRNGPRVRLRAEYGTEAFWQEYRDALAAKAPAKAGGEANTLRWAIDLYRASNTWAKLSNATRRQRENIFRRIIESAGDDPLSGTTESAIELALEKRADRPHAANNLLKTLKALFAFLIKHRIVKKNPTTGIKQLRGANDERGFHTWSPAELERFETTWAIGTRERLAYDFLLYTGLRRGDAVRVGRQHVRDGYITIRLEKTDEEITIPVLEPLARSIAASPTGDLAYLSNAYGEPWVKESFGNWFSDVCRATGCPGSAHGLRKAGATRAAENGASEQQLMALFGWTSPRMASHYVRAANRKRMATSAAALLLEHPANKTAPHLETSRAAPTSKRLK